MKKAYKALSIVMIVLMLSCVCTNVFATTIDTGVLDNLKPNQNLGAAGDKITNIGSTVLSMITTVAMILAVVLIAILGIKYMMGSMEEKAEYKKTLIPYLIGAILVFGAGAIGRMAVEFGATLLQ